MDTRDNIILATDSYKLNHWNQYPRDTEAVYSYFEARPGAAFAETVFFGLQYIIKEFLLGSVVTQSDVDEAAVLAEAHFGNEAYFNRAGWEHIVNEHGGRLPVRIKAVPEGTPVPVGNVMMTVENTDPKCYWLTNALESLLTHVWYPSTVATLSRHTKVMIKEFLDRTGSEGSEAGLPFMLHDFGYRGASSHETAAIGGAGHLVNFVGTDTLPAMLMAMDNYGAKLADLAFSVAATEHSIMTARGREGEFTVVRRLFEEYPTGILSVVADSYDIYGFVNSLGTTYKQRVLARDGVFVVRPDSVTPLHRTPEELTRWIVYKLYESFGGTVNEKGFKVLDPHVRILWGDGIDPEGISKILAKAEESGYSAENFVFGMGGGLLQKVNRDTQRFAFKCSAQKRDGAWHDVQKEPLDTTKASKKGRLKLSQTTDGFETVAKDAPPHDHVLVDDLLVTVFENGELLNEISFDRVRENAAI